MAISAAAISGVAISALASSANPVVPRHKFSRQARVPPPDALKGHAHHELSYRTGQSFFYQRRPTRVALPPVFQHRQLEGNWNRQRVPHTALSFFYQRRPTRIISPPLYPRNLLAGEARRAHKPGPPAFVKHTRLYRPARFPRAALVGGQNRQRVPHTALSSLAVIQRHTVARQAWFPIWLLKGGVWRDFPQEQLELVVAMECPDRRHPPDLSYSFPGVAPAEADSFTGVTDQSFSYPGRVEECR